MQGTKISHYSVEEKIGEGGMGVVYRATDTRLNRQVAVKALPPSFVEDPQRMARFEREAQLLASLNHTNIAGIHGLEQEGDSRYLILELVEGETLAERIERGRLSLEDALGIAEEIAEALEAAHDKGIIHRDLKPANVKITPSGQVKVLDFGLAKALEGAQPSSGDELANSPTLSMAATQAGIILGTAAYMAPEQAAGQPADRRADVWSFGVVLAEMLTGKQLFTGETASHVLAAVLQRDVDLSTELPEVPAPILRLLERCLEKKPRRRLQAIGEARIAIENYLADPAAASADSALPAEPMGAARLPTWRRLAPWAVSGVLLITALGLALIPRSDSQEAEVVRFTFAPPADTALDLDPNAPAPAAVSPDGRHVVFAANGPPGSGLWVRSLDATEPRLLGGTEGAAYPFWSPDSRSIGFFADNKLKRIDVGGGPAVSLTEANNGKGGTWSADGVILFAPSHDEPIHRVAAAGGESTAVTSLAERDVSHRHPEFLPDGEHFLYLARVDDPDNDDVPEIRLASLSGGEERVLLRSPAQAAYASGYLLYTLETTLMARPFDADALAFTGDAVPVVDDVTLVSMGAARAVFSASASGVLVFQSGANQSGANLSWVDRDGKTLGSLGETARYTEVSLSPDDQRLGVVITDSEAGTRDIWVFDLERGIPSRFTFDPRHDDSIVWTADSQTIYFSSERGSSSLGSVYRKSIFGTAEEELVLEREGLQIWPAAVTADERRLVVAQAAVGRIWDIAVYDLESATDPVPFLASDFVEFPIGLSPNEDWLLYGTNESGEFQLYVTSFPAPGRKWQVTTRGTSGGAGWSNDGREILFATEDTIYSVAVEMQPGRLTLGAPQALFEAPNLIFGAGFDITSSRDQLILGQAIENQGGKPVNVVLAWPETLERR